MQSYKNKDYVKTQCVLTMSHVGKRTISFVYKIMALVMNLRQNVAFKQWGAFFGRSFAKDTSEICSSLR
jgi:hypothetical protein